MNRAFNFFIAILLLVFSACFSSEAKSGIEKGRFDVAPGERAAFPLNYVRVQTRLSAKVDFKSFQPFTLGRGNEKLYRGGWVSVTLDEVIVYDVVLKDKTLEEDAAVDGAPKVVKTIRARVPVEVGRFPHGLSFDKVNAVTVSIDAGDEGADLIIRTSKGTFTRTLKNWWAGGEPFIRNDGSSDIRAELAFERKKADAPIWFIADSFFSSVSPNRWPYYMRQAGYNDWMADHLPGGNSKGLLPCFKHDLDFGTPKIVVWELQGNDAEDIGLAPNPEWLQAVEEFTAICREKGITPVFTNSASVRKNRNGRTRWIEEHGYRIIDFRGAVVNEEGTGWKNPSWLSKDRVHPTAEGAKVLWETVRAALPELH